MGTSKAANQGRGAPAQAHHPAPINRLLAAAVVQLSAAPVVDFRLADLAARADVPIEEAEGLFGDADTLVRELLHLIQRIAQDALTRHVAAAPCDDPAAQYLALMHGYLDWAVARPDLYRVLESPSLNRFFNDPVARAYVTGIRDLGRRTLERARAAGQLPPEGDLTLLQLQLRALLQGVIRITVDGLGPRWQLGRVEAADAHAMLDAAAWRFFAPRGAKVAALA